MKKKLPLLCIQISDDTLKRLQAGEDITLEPMKAKKPVTKRAKAICAGAKKVRGRQALQFHILQEDDRRVCDAWNQHTCVRSKPGGDKKRNRPVDSKTVDKNLTLLRTAITTVGIKKLLSEVKLYLTFCASGQHIQETVNYAYTDLFSLLKAILKVKAVGKEETFWWHKVHTGRRNDSRAHLRTQRDYDAVGQLDQIACQMNKTRNKR